MKLADCEISHLHARGVNVAMVIGDRGLASEDVAALHEEFVKLYGDARPVAYVSRDGWQSLRQRQLGPLESRFSFDEAQGIVTIDGVKVAASFVDAFIKPSPAGQWFRVDAGDGATPVITVRREDDFAPVSSAEPPAPGTQAKPAAKGKA